MLYRKFGKTGEKVSILGFGGMRFPILEGNPTKINEPLAREMLEYAIDHGVNYIDTAYMYHASSFTEAGVSETFIGNSLKDGYRDEVYLATKLPSFRIQKKEDFNYYLDEQLKRLQTDYIDFYLIHGVNKGVWGNLKELGVFEFLDSAIDDGRIKYAGFSFHDELDLYKEVVDSYDWSFSQIQLNYMDQEFQAGEAGLEYAASKHMGIAIMEPLRGGSLTNNIPAEVQAIWNKANTKRTPTEWGLRFLWDKPELDIVLSGMTAMEHVVENIKIAEDGKANSLTDEEKNLIAEVKEVYDSRVQVNCTACNYCMPCPSGVDIPGNLRILNELNIYQNMERAAIGYSFLKIGNSDASLCTECGVCEEQCPQKISVKDCLKETQKIFEELQQ